ncbi:hypothetical protein LSM04_006671 [Trypanosoma melophagium]|uniref:uncharacterized protein n=1 Tax=Trypanosoma melophagium TaxID=715481 RepID=UPI00351A6433|nr:hypothetical protein LSM04_006671 [Trypanosoma melophagium]
MTIYTSPRLENGTGRQASDMVISNQDLNKQHSQREKCYAKACFLTLRCRRLHLRIGVGAPGNANRRAMAAQKRSRKRGHAFGRTRARQRERGGGRIGGRDFAEQTKRQVEKGFVAATPQNKTTKKQIKGSRGTPRIAPPLPNGAGVGYVRLFGAARRIGPGEGEGAEGWAKNPLGSLVALSCLASVPGLSP